MPFIPVAEVKEYLNIEGTALDTFLGKLILSVESRIEDYTNQSFALRADIEIVDSTGKVYLNNFPVKQVDKIEALRNGEWVEIYSPTTALEFDIYVTYLDGLPEGRLRVTYKAGYYEPPPAVVQVGIELVAMNYYKSKKGERRLGIRSTSAAAGSSAGVNIAYVEPDMSVLDMYRIPSVKKKNNFTPLTLESEVEDEVL